MVPDHIYAFIAQLPDPPKNLLWEFCRNLGGLESVMPDRAQSSQQFMLRSALLWLQVRDPC